jgi:hypothetical protein
MLPDVSDAKTWPALAATAVGSFNAYEVVTVVGAETVTVFEPESL